MSTPDAPRDPEADRTQAAADRTQAAADPTAATPASPEAAQVPPLPPGDGADDSAGQGAAADPHAAAPEAGGVQAGAGSAPAPEGWGQASWQQPPQDPWRGQQAGPDPRGPGAQQGWQGGGPQQPWQQPPTPSALPSDMRNWSLAAHLSTLIMLVGIPFFVGPLVVWAIAKDRHPFVREHATEALNFNLSLLLYGVVGTVASIVGGLITFGLFLIPMGALALAGVIAWIAFSVIAAVAASNGERYRYPLTIRFVN